MSTSSLTLDRFAYQVPTEGQKIVSELAETQFIQSVIRENAVYEHGAYSLFFADLDRATQKLFLAVVSDPSEYEWASENETRMDAYIAEMTKHMQKKIDEQIDDVFHEAMYEARMNRFDFE